jgi:2-keto-4-pentenoate hydratase
MSAQRDWDHRQNSSRSARAVALTRREHLRLAEVLLRSAGDRQPIAPLSESYPELTAGDAARIRDTAIVRRIAAGEQLIGATVSFGTSPGGNGGSDEPRLGWLTDAMLVTLPQVDVSSLIRPRLEAKVAFVLARPLRGHVRTVGELLALTERVLPCLEILDGRYQGTGVDPVDDIADNCAVASLLVGDGVATPSEDDLMRVRVQLEPPPHSANGSPVRLSSPVRATLWLANQVIDEAGELEAGALLVSSACCPGVDLLPGVHASADFGVLGHLELETTGDVRR